MKIVYVEDKALKIFVQQVLGLFRKNYPVRMLKDPGGWPEVLKMVLNSKESQVASVGIVEGDVRKHVEGFKDWGKIKDRIYVTKDKEIESYFFRKRETISDIKEKMRGPEKYGKFKKFIEKNRDACKVLSKFIARQNCEEINEFVDFLESGRKR